MNGLDPWTYPTARPQDYLVNNYYFRAGRSMDLSGPFFFRAVMSPKMSKANGDWLKVLTHLWSHLCLTAGRVYSSWPDTFTFIGQLEGINSTAGGNKTKIVETKGKSRQMSRQ